MKLFFICLIGFMFRQIDSGKESMIKNTPYLNPSIPVVVIARGLKNNSEVKPLENYLNDKLKKNNYTITTLQNATDLMTTEIDQYVKSANKKTIAPEDIFEESKRLIKTMPATYQRLIFRLVLNDAKKIDSCFYQVIYYPNGIRLPKNGGYLHDSLLQKNDLNLLLDCVYDSVTIKR